MEQINKKQIEAEELAMCFTQLTNSMARIYEANDNVTPLTRMLDEMAGRINQMRVLRLKSKK
jgi:hypothetical protein